MKKNKWQIILCACFFVLGIVISGTTCMAADTGSIRIEYLGRTKEDEEIVLENAEFILYHVGYMKDGQWVTAGEFQSAGVSLEKGESSERNKQAERLYAYALSKKIQGSMQKTDTKGVAEFTGLREGLYLVAQTVDWQKSGIGVFRSAPFLISVPGAIDGILTWDVVSDPKSEWVSQEEKPVTPQITETPQTPADSIDTGTEKPNKVKTGDSTPIEILLIVTVGSACLAGILWKKKETKN